MSATQPAETHPIKAKLRAGGVALGINTRLARSGDIARIAKVTGHDFLFIDTQHAIYDLQTIGHIAQTAQAIGIAPLVRVRSVTDPDISVMLDSCVTGIVFPDVNTAADARRAVDAVRFAPLGRRSLGGTPAQLDFRPMPLGPLMHTLNEQTLLVCMIETVEGLANVEAIAATPGIDILHVGSTDLLADMGMPGQFDCPEIIAAQARVNAAARANNLFAGCGGNRDVTRQAAAIRAGAQFLTTQTDIAFLVSAAAAWTSGVKALLEAGET